MSNVRLLSLGIIMGPATTFHMLLGAIVGWGILSPLTKNKGWAPGPVDNWSNGSKGWIVWVSLAIMLADSVINLGWLFLRPVALRSPQYFEKVNEWAGKLTRNSLLHPQQSATEGYRPLNSYAPANVQNLDTSQSEGDPSRKSEDIADADAPSHHLVSNSIVAILTVISILVCFFSVKIVFGALIPYYAILLAIFLALILSLMGVRALGETDINPVSGISKLSQLFFALVIPASNPNAVTINLLAGAISESGALQAGDMMQDLKCGHLLGAAPKAQFYGQIIGSFVGAVVSAGIYQLYTNVYKVQIGRAHV